MDLSGYALKSEIPTIPTDVSAFNNDVGYLTQHQDLSDYAKKSDIVATDLSNYYTKNEVYTKTEVENVVDTKLGVIENGTY